MPLVWKIKFWNISGKNLWQHKWLLEETRLWRLNTKELCLMIVVIFKFYSWKFLHFPAGFYKNCNPIAEKLTKLIKSCIKWKTKIKKMLKHFSRALSWMQICISFLKIGCTSSCLFNFCLLSINWSYANWLQNLKR